MIVVRSTKNCPNTPRILFGLEELGLPYSMERVEDGVFERDWGSPGPSIHDGDVTTIEPGAILRHFTRRAGKLWPTSLVHQADADRWMEFQGRRISMAVEKADAPTVMRLMGFVEAHLKSAVWMIGDEFSIVDVLYSLFATPAAEKRMPFIPSLPALSTYIARIRERPAFMRSLALAREHLSS